MKKIIPCRENKLASFLVAEVLLTCMHYYYYNIITLSLRMMTMSSNDTLGNTSLTGQATN